MKKIILISCLFITSGFARTAAFESWLHIIRDPETKPYMFRYALEEIGEHLAWEAYTELEQEEFVVTTLTGEDATHQLAVEIPVLVTILRAGLPLNHGVQNVFGNSEVGFLAMSRNEETLKAKVDYVALPEMKDRCVIITDTMLATGGSLLDAIRIVEKYGPKKIICLAAIASEPGIARIREYNPKIKVIAAAIDPKLNDKGYIIPGLGDAGDRSFGNKCHH